MPTLTVHRTRFLEDEIVDGDFYGGASTEIETEIIDCAPDSFDIEDGLTAVDIASRKLCEIGTIEWVGSWWDDPDGSYISNYRTAERIETSAHPKGFSDTEIGAILEEMAS